MSYREKIDNQRKGERFISVSEIARACDMGRLEQHQLDTTLKEAAAQYWLEVGGSPAHIRQAPVRVRQRSLSGNEMTEPAYSQSLLTQLIVSGALKPKEGYTKAPFFSLAKEDQLAIIESIGQQQDVAPEVVKARDHRSAVTQQAIRSGLSDQVRS